ncbi:MAG: alanine--glyoxylate aminotransferase family protein [bacterium]
MKKKYLMTPGPTPVSNKALTAMAEPIIHHRHPEFQGILEEVRAGLKELFQTEQEVLLLASSGTGAMEGSVVNTLRKGDRVVVIRGGKFGERWAEISEAYGLEVDNIDVPWGQAVDPAEVEKKLEKPARAVMVQYTETSTGVSHPVKKLAELTRGTDTLLFVDGITGVGVSPIPFDQWGIDVLVTGSQKALMLPPGLGFACLSDKAWKATESSDLPKFYFDFPKEHKKIKENSTNYTPAITLIIGMREVLREFREVGFENVYQENAAMARATRAAAVALGLELFAPDAPSDALTAIKAPAGVDGQDIVKTMRDEMGIAIAGGQAEAKGKIFRIAHMGFISKWDLLATIGALEKTLSKLGHSFTPGAGTSALISELEI